MLIEVKAEDLQIGDSMSLRRVADLFYRTNTLARTNKSGKGVVVVMFDDHSVEAYPIGHKLAVFRTEDNERTEPDG